MQNTCILWTVVRPAANFEVLGPKFLRFLAWKHCNHCDDRQTKPGVSGRKRRCDLQAQRALKLESSSDSLQLCPGNLSESQSWKPTLSVLYMRVPTTQNRPDLFLDPCLGERQPLYISGVKKTSQLTEGRMWRLYGIPMVYPRLYDLQWSTHRKTMSGSSCSFPWLPIFTSREAEVPVRSCPCLLAVDPRSTVSLRWGTLEIRASGEDTMAGGQEDGRSEKWMDGILRQLDGRYMVNPGRIHQNLQCFIGIPIVTLPSSGFRNHPQ